MMHYIGVTLGVLLVELTGVAAMTGVMHVYWKLLAKK